jgi:hypothetical protein
MNQKTIAAVVIATACAFSAGCSDDEPEDTIDTTVNPNATFSEYQTFAFVGPSDVDPTTARVIPDAVMVNLDVANQAMREELTALGLIEVGPNDNPDLRAFSLSTTQDEAAIYWACVDGYWYGYWAWSFDPCSWLEPVYTEYTEGTILVGLVDPNMGEVVFGGLIQGIAYGDSGDMEERIDDDMEEVFDAYPAN